ncbi:MAG: hypothetical protein RL210_298, partial [Pseudomonadota bacterium]
GVDGYWTFAVARKQKFRIWVVCRGRAGIQEKCAKNFYKHRIYNEYLVTKYSRQL